jgi:plastocyanin
MHKISKSKIVFLLLLVCAGLFGGIVLFTQQSQDVLLEGTAQVVLTPDGFSPEKVRISQGTTVTFTTTTGKAFWPASDLHPSHSIYPAFDPKEPVAATASWSFTFNDQGTFSFHDHLSPYYTGEVIVGKGRNTPSLRSLMGAVFASEVTRCDGLSDADKKGCWISQVRDTVKNHGLDRGATLVKKLYDHDPIFGPNCHDVTHGLGRAAYEFPQGTHEVSVPEYYSLCGFGFYHGFMETLIQLGGDIAQAKALCDGIAGDNDANVRVSRAVCYHGVGHGAVLQHENSTDDIATIIEAGLPLCDKVSAEEGARANCVNGVIDGAMALVTGGTFQASQTLLRDPYSICKDIRPTSKEPCYVGLNWYLLFLTKNDFAAAAAYITGIEEPGIQAAAMISLASLYTQVVKESPPGQYHTLRAACMGLSPKLESFCMQGLASGLMLFGAIPGREYERGAAFCTTALPEGSAREECLGYVLDTGATMYQQEAYDRLCADFHQSYGTTCSQ